MKEKPGHDEIIQAVDRICEKDGAISKVGPEFYRKFPEFSAKAMNILLKIVIREEANSINSVVFGEKAGTTDEIVTIVQGTLRCIALGRFKVREDYRIGVCKPIGPKPTKEESEAIEARLRSLRDSIIYSLGFVMGEQAADDRWHKTQVPNGKSKQ